MKSRNVLVGSIAVVGFAGFLLLVRPVFAQTVVGQLIDLLTSKAGFNYGDNSGFVFTKETPNYIAYAGDRTTAGGHRIMLALGRDQVEFSFLSADVASVSAGVATDSAALSQADQAILTLAEQILDRQATTSGDIASESAIMIDESGILPDEHVTLASASGILSAGTTAATGSATLTQEQLDFLLYVQLKTWKVTQSSLAINKEIAGAIQQASQVLSTAKLEEDEKERKVVFNSIANGIDMVYRLNENGILQEISIANRDTHTNVFTFAINPHGLTYKNLGHSSWSFSDSFGRVMRFTHGYVMDAAGKFTNDFTTNIFTKDGKDIVTFTVPADWLADPARVYPVTVHNALEIVPELRVDYPGAAEARALRGTSVITADITPTNSPAPSITPSPTPVATPTPTPTIIEAAPTATDSGILEGTPSAIPVSEVSPEPVVATESGTQ